MKNLKKVLALVLVVAMMASFAVGASAAFKDADKITYTTAVDVLSGLGVINGYADGTFRATDSVTRGAFAKMTAYVMNGGVNAAASYGTYAAASFKDVAANSTFGNAIGYCTNKRIISGYSDGTFRAGNKVTGVQAAKMLLGALGYDSKIEGYTGSAWAKNVLADAEDAGLFKGMGAVDLTQPLTREAAAQMIWNALQATMVKYAVGGVTITTPDGTTVNTGASAAEPVMTGNVNGFGTTKLTTLEMVEKYFENLKVVPGTHDEYGRPTVEYQLKGKAIAADTKVATKTYAGTFTGADATALTKTYKTTSTTFTYNGGTDASIAKLADLYIDAKTPVNGYNVEVYTDANNEITDVVVIEGYLAKVGPTTAATKTRPASVKLTINEIGYAKTHSDAAVTMTIVNDPDKVDLYDIITANFTTGEYVVAYCNPGWNTKTDGSAIIELKKTESVSGTISKVVEGGKACTSTITMDGTTYKLVNEFVTIADDGKVTNTRPTPSATAKGTLYLVDGSVIGYVGENVNAQNKAVLVTNTYSTLENGKIVGKVEGVVASGETQTFTGDTTTVTAGTVYEFTTNPATGVTTFAAATGTTVADAATYNMGKATIAKGALSVTLGSTKCYFDSNVKFIYWGGTPAKATVLTGKRAVTTATQMYAVIAMKGMTPYITAVYVGSAPADDNTVTSDSIVYIAGQNAGSTNALVDGKLVTLYSYTAFVGGEEVENFFSTDNGKGAGFYVNKQNTASGAYILDTPYNATTGAAAVVEKAAVTGYAAGVLTAGGHDYDASAAKIVDLSKDGAGITTTTKVCIVYNATTMVASYIYVVD